MNFTNLNKLVINLPKRTERLEQFYKELIYLPCSNLEVIAGIENFNPRKGIAEAHLSCITKAKQNGWDAVLIMEDDLVFQGKEKTYDYLLNCLSNLPTDWDILLGGVYFSKGLQKYNAYWNRIGEFCALHFYIVNSKAYDQILTHDFEHHIDRFMNLNGEKLKCFVTAKFIATQRDGYSDNRKDKVQYGDLLRKFTLL